MTVDFRTRRDDRVDAVEPVSFFDEELPRLAASRLDLASRATRLGLSPLKVVVGTDAWLLDAADDRVVVRRARADDPPATWTLDPDQLGRVVDDLVTPVGLLTAGDLVTGSTGIARVMNWWLVLRSLVDDRPVHLPGDIELDVDLDRSFTLDDDPDEIRNFLETAGFLRLREVFTPGEMERISADMDREAPTYHDGDGHSWWATLADGTRRLVRMQRFDEHSDATAALLRDERPARIRSIVGCGHDVRWDQANRIEALFKPLDVVEGISDIPWHADCSLGRHSYECASLTIGISISGAGPGTGQLRVIAGSHRALCWPSLLDVTTLGLPDVPLATETGDVTVHLSCTLHRAEPPTVAERRVLYTGAALPAPDPDATAAARAELYRTSREGAPQRLSQPAASAGSH